MRPVGGAGHRREALQEIVSDRGRCLGVYGSIVEPGQVREADSVRLESTSCANGYNRRALGENDARSFIEFHRRVGASTTVLDPAQWQGLNLLGKALMSVRQTLR